MRGRCGVARSIAESGTQCVRVRRSFGDASEEHRRSSEPGTQGRTLTGDTQSSSCGSSHSSILHPVFFVPHPVTIVTIHSAILVIVDRLTKQSLFIPTHDSINSPELAQLFLTHIFSKHSTLSHVVDSEKCKTMHTQPKTIPEIS